MAVKATDQQIMDAYSACGSVWIAAEMLGMCGQSVHERLVRLGIERSSPAFSTEEKVKLLEKYETAAASGTLDVLAEEMGRTKQFICRKARGLGLTRANRKRPYSSESSSKSTKAWIAENGHPRGALGMRHTEEAKAAIGRKSAANWAAKTEQEKADQVLKSMKTRAAKYGSLAVPRNASWKAGWREIGETPKYYRSRWEANYARYLEWLKIRGEISAWQHEPETFWFEAIKRGVRSYLPDFRVWEIDGSSKLHEVKGWMDDRSRTTLRRMAKYHPKEVVILIDAKQYASISAKVSRLIEGWES